MLATAARILLVAGACGSLAWVAFAGEAPVDAPLPVDEPKPAVQPVLQPTVEPRPEPRPAWAHPDWPARKGRGLGVKLGNGFAPLEAR